MGAAIALALALQVGDLASAGDRCGRVVFVDLNPAGISFAWLELAGDAPRNVARVQLEQLQRCAPITPREGLQHVLKAEPAKADATDRSPTLP